MPDETSTATDLLNELYLLTACGEAQRAIETVVNTHDEVVGEPPMTVPDTSLEASAVHWDTLAAREEDMAHWEEGRGLPYGSVTVYYNRAILYRKTATALRLEAETGIVHYVECGHPAPDHKRGVACPRCKR
jgi:hypothetical protein